MKNIHLEKLACDFFNFRSFALNVAKEVFRSEEYHVFKLEMHNACPYMIFKDFIITPGDYFSVKFTSLDKHFYSSDFDEMKQFSDRIMKYEPNNY